MYVCIQRAVTGRERALLMIEIMVVNGGIRGNASQSWKRWADSVLYAWINAVGVVVFAGVVNDTEGRVFF